MFTPKGSIIVLLALISVVSAGDLEITKIQKPGQDDDFDSVLDKAIRDFDVVNLMILGKLIVGLVVLFFFGVIGIYRYLERVCCSVGAKQDDNVTLKPVTCTIQTV